MVSSPIEHIARLKERIENWAFKRAVEIRDERFLTEKDAGFIRIRVEMVNGDLLEVAEYVATIGDRLSIVGYKYHWQDASGNLIKRWDNAAHHPQLANYPHHVHNGHEDTVIPSQTDITLDVVLQQITAHLQEESV